MIFTLVILCSCFLIYLFLWAKYYYASSHTAYFDVLQYSFPEQEWRASTLRHRNILVLTEAFSICKEASPETIRKYFCPSPWFCRVFEIFTTFQHHKYDHLCIMNISSSETNDPVPIDVFLPNNSENFMTILLNSSQILFLPYGFGYSFSEQRALKLFAWSSPLTLCLERLREK